MSGFFAEIEGWLKQDAADRMRAIASVIPAHLDTRRPWCDPSFYDLIVGMDFGSGFAHFHELQAGRDTGRVPLDKVTDFVLSLPHRSLLVAEASGFRPQTQRSLAQPLTAQQICILRDKCPAQGIEVRTFPHQHTTRARVWAANHSSGLVERDKTDDLNDARALAFFVAHNNGISLGKIPASFEMDNLMRRYARSVRRIAGTTLNAMKARGYEGQVFPGLARIASDVFSKYVGEPYEPIREKVAFSIVALTACEMDGKLVRFVRQGKAPGADSWMKRVFGTTPMHHRGGVARANSYRDQFRPFCERVAQGHGLTIKAGASYINFGDHSEEQSRIVTAAHRMFRTAIRRAYRFAVEITGHLPPLEVLGMEDKSHGR